MTPTTQIAPEPLTEYLTLVTDAQVLAVRAETEAQTLRRRVRDLATTLAAKAHLRLPREVAIQRVVVHPTTSTWIHLRDLAREPSVVVRATVWTSPAGATAFVRLGQTHPARALPLACHEGRVYVVLGDPDDATLHVLPASAHRPDHAAALFAGLGASGLRTGDFDWSAVPPLPADRLPPPSLDTARPRPARGDHGAP